MPATEATQGGGQSAAEQAAQEKAIEIAAEMANMKAALDLAVIIAAVAGAFAIYHFVSFGTKYMRRIATMNSNRQQYFAQRNALSDAKQHLTYAPLFGRRLNKNLSLGPTNLGTIPSRLHTILLLALLGVNIYYLVRDLTIPLPAEALGSLYNRAATLALVDAIPLFVFAGRKNPLIPLLGVDFNAFNTLHRWIGRLTIAMILVHAIPVMYAFSLEGGTAAISEKITKVAYIRYGFAAVICWVVIGIQAGPSLRKAFYETFLLIHQILVLGSLVLLYLHTKQFWQNALVVSMIISWGMDRGLRFLNLAMNNFGRKGTEVLAEVMPGEAMRITIYTARLFNVKPGSHVYLYLPAVALWTSHPFSVAWSENQSSVKQKDDYDIEKDGLVVSSRAIVSEASMSLVVRKRAGMTATLYNRAQKAGGKISLRAMIEGPYGALHGLDSYGTVLLFAGGVGITHQVPYLQHLVQGFADGTVACRKLVLVWAVQSSEHLEWVRPWMTAVLGMEGRRDLLRIMIFVTRPDATQPAALDVQSPSQSVQMFPGRRPDIPSIVDAEAADQIGTMAISVCGSGPLSDDVRAAARKQQQFGNVDLFDEAFSW